jgi:ABC-2 type transport system ATP-binding protein
MLQQGGLYPAITAREALALFAHFYASPRPPDDLLQLVGLREAASTRYRQLSGGQKQRLSLALALVGGPAVVFLDEPTSGLDLGARRATWEIIRSLKNDGVTVVLTTHYLEEAERLADRVAIMSHGKLAALGTLEELVGGDGATVRLTTASPIEVDALASLPAASEARACDHDTYILRSADPPQLLVEVAALLRDRGIGVRTLQVGSGSLEDVFLELTGSEGER